MKGYEKYTVPVRRFQYSKAIIKKNPFITYFEVMKILRQKFGNVNFENENEDILDKPEVSLEEKTTHNINNRGMLKLHTEIKIDAAHHLPNYEGKCNQLHGHTWKVVVEIEGVKHPKTGMIVDFVEIKKIVNEFDHGCINDFIQNPTAENIVDYFLDKFSVFNFPKITIRVYESENSYIEGTR